MSLAIPMIPTNADFLLAANDGDEPRATPMQTKEGPTYLLVSQGERNRVITHKELMATKRMKQVKTTQRKFYLIK